MGGSSPAAASSPPGPADEWRLVATVLLVVSGLYNLLRGIAAVATDDWLLVDELDLGDYGVWGVVYIMLGILALLAAPGVRRGSRTSILLAIVVTVVCAVDALASSPEEPVWAVIALAVYGVLLYALIGRAPAGARRRRTA